MKNMSNELYELFNKQIIHEIQNSFVYKNISSHLHRIGLVNLGKYFENASREELEHRDLLISYLIDRNISVDISNIDMVKVDVSSMLGIAQFALEREEDTTELIKNMIKQSNYDSDFLSYHFLLSFIELQRNEEAEAQNLLDNISGIDDDDRLLRIFDQNFEG